MTEQSYPTATREDLIRILDAARTAGATYSADIAHHLAHANA